MLTEKENHLNVQWLRLLSFLNILPIHFEKGKGRFCIQKTRWRIVTCKVFFTLAVIRWLQMAVPFIYKNRNKDFESNSDKFVAGYIIMSIPFMGTFLHFLLLGNMPTDIIVILNHVFLYRSQSDGYNRPFFAFKLYGLQEFMARTIPFVIHGTAGIIVAFLGTEFSKNYRVYSSLPDSLKNGWTYFGCLAYEACTVCFWSSGGAFTALVVGLFQLKFQQGMEQAQKEIRKLAPRENIKNRIDNLSVDEERCLIQTRRQIFMQISELSLFVRLFNQSFAFANYSAKIFCISLFVLTSFFAIRNFQDSSLQAFFSAYVAVVCTVVYAAMYAKGFRIASDFDDIKINLLNMILLNGTENENENLDQPQAVENGPRTGNTTAQFSHKDLKEDKHRVQMITTEVQVLNLAPEIQNETEKKQKNQRDVPRKRANHFDVEMVTCKTNSQKSRAQHERGQTSVANTTKTLKQEEQAKLVQRIQKRKENVREIRKQIASIQRVAMKVGNFQEIEQASTLIFINYGIDNLVSLLVTFPKK